TQLPPRRRKSASSSVITSASDVKSMSSCRVRTSSGRQERCSWGRVKPIRSGGTGPVTVTTRGAMLVDLELHRAPVECKRAAGGVRFTNELTLDLVRANAMWNTWKAALVQIPYGGAFGGVVVNPRRLSAHEREGLTRRYATEIKPMIGPEKDIPSPDVNTGSQ